METNLLCDYFYPVFVCALYYCLLKHHLRLTKSRCFPLFSRMCICVYMSYLIFQSFGTNNFLQKKINFNKYFRKVHFFIFRKSQFWRFFPKKTLKMAKNNKLFSSTARYRSMETHFGLLFKKTCSGLHFLGSIF